MYIQFKKVILNKYKMYIKGVLNSRTLSFWINTMKILISASYQIYKKYYKTIKRKKL